VIMPPAGLSQELQKGWAGTYLFQWFLRGAFWRITGDPHDPGILDTSSFTNRFTHVPIKGKEEITRVAFSTLWALNLSPAKRAVRAIQGIGFLMYHGGTNWKIPIPCWWDVADVDIREFEYFNFPMVLHAYQIGMTLEGITGTPDQREVYEIDREMSRLIEGVLAPGEAKTEIDLRDLVGQALEILMPEFWEQYFKAFLAITDVLCDWNVSVNVGLRKKDPDLYAATIARIYDLPRMCEKEEERASFCGAIAATLAKAPGMFADALPVGAKRKNLPEMIDHNPEHKVGWHFVWEKSPSNRVMPGGGCGLEDATIKALYDRGLDAMCEGAGLGYLLPQALLAADSARLPHFWENGTVTSLPVCFTLPRLAAPFAPSSDTPCDCRFPEIGADRFDGPDEGNDTYLTARKLDYWTTDLNLHRGTRFPYSYAKYTTKSSGEVFSIYPEVDRDCFYFEGTNDAPQLTVTVTAREEVNIVVDGTGGQQVGGDPLNKNVTVPSAGTHRLLVTSAHGGVVAYYSIVVRRVPEAKDLYITAMVNTATTIQLCTGTAVIESLPTHGRLSLPTFSTGHINAAPAYVLGGIVTYTPNYGYMGSDQFTYTEVIGESKSKVSTVYITVTRMP
jgi:hypothetical protein